MRAYQLPKGAAGIEALAQVERPDPKPAYRQVLVRVKACSLNFRDFAIARGSYRMAVRENLIPLSDGAGEVVEIGPGVTRVKVGDRVAGNFFQRWSGGEPASDVHKSALGGGIDGTRPVIRISCKVRAAFQSSACNLRARWVFAPSLLRPATRNSAARKPSGRRLASITEPRRTGRKAAVDFTGGTGVDHVVEVGGAATLTRSFGAIRVGGKVTLIGGLSGGAAELNPALIFARRANVLSISVGSTEMFEAMNRAVAANAIKPVIDTVFGFAEWQRSE